MSSGSELEFKLFGSGEEPDGAWLDRDEDDEEDEEVVGEEAVGLNGNGYRRRR